jgi:hypothetical protein
MRTVTDFPANVADIVGVMAVGDTKYKCSLLNATPPLGAVSGGSYHG